MCAMGCLWGAQGEESGAQRFLWWYLHPAHKNLHFLLAAASVKLNQFLICKQVDGVAVDLCPMVLIWGMRRALPAASQSVGSAPGPSSSTVLCVAAPIAAEPSGSEGTAWAHSWVSLPGARKRASQKATLGVPLLQALKSPNCNLFLKLSPCCVAMEQLCVSRLYFAPIAKAEST